MSSAAATERTLVVRHGTLIDGSGRPPVANDALVIEGNRIKSVGPLPESLRSSGSRDDVEVIDASGQWIMPGLIDAHTHLSYGYPYQRGEGRGRGTTRPELGVLKAAWSAQKVLRSGVTSISVPGGTWFTDVGVRDAIKLGVLEGPRVHCAGRMIITYGSIEDDEPAWVGTPDHSVGVLCNSAAEMVTEVRRQCKHGVNFVKMADSRSGEVQTLARDEIAAVVDEAHRRGARVAIHSRGSASTRAAAEAGVDWLIHCDLATEADLDAIARAGCAILPTMTFLAMVVEAGGRYGQEMIQMDVGRMKRHFDGLIRVVERARARGIRILCGTDTGNNTFMPFGELHAKELEIFVTYCGFTPMEAIVAATRGNAFAIGLEGEVGVLEPGKLADIVVLKRDPVADIKALAGGRSSRASSRTARSSISAIVLESRTRSPSGNARRGVAMSIRRVVPDIGSDRFDESRQFYADVLGFKVVMDLGSVVTLASPTNPRAQITRMRRDDSSRLLPQVTIEVADVDAVYNEAARRGARVLFPPRDESWGVRRFFLLDPNDVVISVMTHRPGRPGRELSSQENAACVAASRRSITSRRRPPTTRSAHRRCSSSGS